MIEVETKKKFVWLKTRAKISAYEQLINEPIYKTGRIMGFT